MKAVFVIILFFVSLIAVNAQEPITVTGNTLKGMIINGENVREVIGNVEMTQGRVRITCDKAVQFLASNNAELIGNVVAVQDSIIIKTPKGFYYGNTKKAESESGVTLYDGQAVLSAIKGDYFFNDDKAFFRDSVKLTDSASVLYCDTLFYYNDTNKAEALGNAILYSDDNRIAADSLFHYRDEKITFGYGHVIITDIKNGASIYGGKLEDYSLRKYSLMTKNPVLMQIDTSNSGLIDTLLMASLRMESYRDSLQRFAAIDSVRIVRGPFASVNDSTVYMRGAEQITTLKRYKIPVMWNDLTQISGDTIKVYLKDNTLDSIYINENAIIMSQNEYYKERYDQISGNRIYAYFDSSGITRTNIYENSLSIYYMYDEGEPNGLIKSSSKNAKIFFGNKRPDAVKLYVSPVSEFYPESVVKGNELEYTLPSFKIYKNRPRKEELLNLIN